MKTENSPQEAMKELWESRASDGDVTIKCSNVEFRAHKLVLESRAQYFKGFFRSRWLESNSGVLEIKDEDPKLFRCLLYYIYLNVYSPEDPSDPVIHVRMYRVADQYGFDTLAAEATAKFERLLSEDPKGCERSLIEIAREVGETRNTATEGPKKSLLGFIKERIDELAEDSDFLAYLRIDGELAVDLFRIQTEMKKRPGVFHCTTKRCNRLVQTHSVPACDRCDKANNIKHFSYRLRDGNEADMQRWFHQLRNEDGAAAELRLRELLARSSTTRFLED